MNSSAPTVAVADHRCGEASHIPLPGALGELALHVLRDGGIGRGHLDIAFVGVAEMAELNALHMGKSGPTDVLAFPLDAADPDPVLAADSRQPVLLGDVVICTEVAERNAIEHGCSLDDEVALLVVHGVLHVLGMDHAEPVEREEMRERERRLLRKHHPPEASRPTTTEPVQS